MTLIDAKKSACKNQMLIVTELIIMNLFWLMVTLPSSTQEITKETVPNTNGGGGVIFHMFNQCTECTCYRNIVIFKIFGL